MDLDQTLDTMKKEGLLPENATYLDLLDRLDDEAASTIRLKAAIQDPKTGKIYSGENGDHHKDIAAKIQDPELKQIALDAADKDDNPAGGFIDALGNFLSRQQADKQYGIHTSQQLDEANGNPKVDAELIAKGLSPAQVEEALVTAGTHTRLLAKELKAAKETPTQQWPGPTEPK